MPYAKLPTINTRHFGPLIALAPAMCSRAESRARRSTIIIDRRLAWLAYLSPGLFFGESWDLRATQNRVAFRDTANARSGRNALHSTPSLRRDNCTRTQYHFKSKTGPSGACFASFMVATRPFFCPGFSCGALRSAVGSQPADIQPVNFCARIAYSAPQSMGRLCGIHPAPTLQPRQANREIRPSLNLTTCAQANSALPLPS